jgi:hypothetical protein
MIRGIDVTTPLNVNYHPRKSLIVLAYGSYSKVLRIFEVLDRVRHESPIRPVNDRDGNAEVDRAEYSKG